MVEPKVIAPNSTQRCGRFNFEARQASRPEKAVPGLTTRSSRTAGAVILVAVATLLATKPPAPSSA